MFDAQVVEMITENMVTLAGDVEAIETAFTYNLETAVAELKRDLHNMYMLLAEEGLIKNPADGGKSIF